MLKGILFKTRFSPYRPCCTSGLVSSLSSMKSSIARAIWRFVGVLLLLMEMLVFLPDLATTDSHHREVRQVSTTCSTTGKILSNNSCCGVFSQTSLSLPFTYVMSANEVGGRCCRDRFTYGSTASFPYTYSATNYPNQCFCDTTLPACHTPALDPCFAGSNMVKVDDSTGQCGKLTVSGKLVTYSWSPQEKRGVCCRIKAMADGQSVPNVMASVSKLPGSCYCRSVTTTPPTNTILPSTSPPPSSPPPTTASPPTNPPVSTTSSAPTTLPPTTLPSRSPPVSTTPPPTTPPVSTTLPPTYPPFSTTLPPISTPVSTTLPTTSPPVSTTLPPTSLVSSTMPPTSPPVSTTIPPTYPPFSTTLPPTSNPVSTTLPTTSPPVSTTLPPTSLVSSTVPPTSPPVSTTLPPTYPSFSTTLPPTSTTVSTTLSTTSPSVSTTLPTTSLVSSTMPPTSPPVFTTLPPTYPPFSTTLPPTSTNVSTTLPPTSTPVSATLPQTLPPVSTTLASTSSLVSTTLPPTSTPVSTTLPPISPSLSTLLPPTSAPVSTTLPSTSPPLSTTLPPALTTVSTPLPPITSAVSTASPTQTSPTGTASTTTASTTTMAPNCTVTKTPVAAKQNNTCCGTLFVYTSYDVALYEFSSQENSGACCRMNAVSSEVTDLRKMSTFPGYCYCDKKSAPECFDACPVPGFSSRMEGGTVLTDPCSRSGIVTFSASNNPLACHGVFIFNPVGPTSFLPELYLPSACAEAFRQFTAYTLYGKSANATFNWTGQVRLRGTPVAGLSAFLPTDAAMTSLKFACAGPACAYKPVNMRSLINFTGCKLYSYGYNLDANGKPTYTGEFKYASVELENPATCQSNTLKAVFKCWKFTEAGTHICTSDSGAPIYCPLSTGEWAVYGLLDVVTSCRPLPSFAVIPVSPDA